MTTRRQSLSLLAAVALAPALPGCGGGTGSPGSPQPTEPQFSFEGLAGRIVHRLRPSAGGELLAATDNGVYQRTASASWATRGLAGQHVFDIAAVAPQRWLASVRDAANADAQARLVETSDGGLNWQPVSTNFGGAYPETIQALVHDAAAGRLLATGTNVLAESRDFGRTWVVLGGEFQSFGSPKTALALDPALGDVWYGGQDAIEGLTLYRWRQADRQVIEHHGLMPAPSVVKGIRFAQGQPARLLVAGEGGIVQSTNRGTSWQRILADGHNFYFDAVQDPQRPTRWVTARWEKNFADPQALLVKVSDDDGHTWRDVRHPDSRLFGGVWSLAVQVVEGRTVFTLGLYKGGVMRLELP